MRYRDEANKVLVATEASLRSLAEKALADRAYNDVAHIASLTESIRAILHGANVDSVVQSSQPKASTNNCTTFKRSDSVQKSNARALRAYPRFERESDKLVKVGWSKKAREEYEHKAPRRAVETFANCLASSVKAGKTFLIEDLLPVRDSTGREIPSYQVYLTLAWLRQLGAVQKLGREGYVLQSDTIVNGGLDEMWTRTRERMHE